MTNQKKPTQKIKNPTATILLHDGQICIIDADNLEWLSCFKWRAVKKLKSYYAYTTVHGPRTDRSMSMHRMVAKTPSGYVCHHRNRNSLDNRHNNLLNMTRKEHEKLHRNHTFSRKIDPDYDGITPIME